MPRYRIYRLSERQAEAFRTRPPKSGPAVLRPNSYEEAGAIEAAHPYAAWKTLHEAGSEPAHPEVAAEPTPPPLGIGDVLVPDDGPPLLLNYWGFDAAQWRETEPVDELAEQAV